MSNLIILTLLALFTLTRQNKGPDFTKADDLKALGTGKVIKKDNCIIKNVKLLQVNEYWIVYEKNSSSHDLLMESIRRIEFPESKWGAVKIEFRNNMAEMLFTYE